MLTPENLICQNQEKIPNVEVTACNLPSCDTDTSWLSLCVVTPSGSCSNPPKEYQEGEAGFAIMFPSMDGVHIKPFHFCKKSISPTALKEAGEWRPTTIIQLSKLKDARLIMSSRACSRIRPSFIVLSLYRTCWQPRAACGTIVCLWGI